MSKNETDASVDFLVQSIEKGKLRLPELQRHYVWDAKRVRDLLDSLYRNYPSGSILTWETDEEVKTRSFATEETIPETKYYELLLDGQQRLTSLNAILKGLPVRVRDKKTPVYIFFNLEHPEGLERTIDDDEVDDMEETDLDETVVDSSDDKSVKQPRQMTFSVRSSKIADLKHWVPVTEVFKSEGNTEILKQAGVTDWDDPKYEKYNGRLDRLRSIKNYEYRVYKLPQELSYEEVTNIFVRVNSRGVHLRSYDLALAIISAKWSGSRIAFEEFDDLCGKKPGLAPGVPTQLRNLVVFATNRSNFSVVHKLSKSKLRQAWDDAKEGMEKSLNYLHSIGIESMSLLSSPFIVVALAKLLSEHSGVVGPRLRQWVLTANAKARYSRGSTETLLDEDLKTIEQTEHVDQLLTTLEENLRKQVGTLVIRAEDLAGESLKSALFKTMFLAFRDSGANDWGDGYKISLKSTGKKHALQYHHIFPRSVLKNEGMEPREINDISNLAFISADENRGIGARLPIEYLREIEEEQLKKQCVPVDDQLWMLENYSKFLAERRKHVASRLNEFLGSE